MASSFEYNAPTYMNFDDSNPVNDSDGADVFFDVETEIQTDEKENVQPQALASDSSKAFEASTSQQDSKIVLDDVTQSERKSSNSKRRSILKARRSMSNINTEPENKINPDNHSEEKYNPADNLSDSMTKLSVKPKKSAYFEGIPITIKEEKPHPMTTRTDSAANASRLSLRSREVIKEEPENRKRKGSHLGMETRTEKYIALAENILRFQKDTPPRFRTHRSNVEDKERQLMLRKRQSYRPCPTVAKTPRLLTRTRARPSVAPSQADREADELEEARRHQIKAHPLNEKVFHLPQPLKKGRKSTVVQPFHLTEVVKKPVEPKTEVFQFKARPLPKKVLDGPTGLGAKKEIPLTVPESPAITKRPTRHAVTTWTENTELRQEVVGSFGVPLSRKLAPLQKTVVQPFSFEQRDKLLMEKKEKKLQEIFEEEKKARQFKANPVPAFLPPREGHSSKCSIVSSADTSQTTYQFRARSPVVLKTKPFKPVTEGKHSKPMDVTLNTERRAVERQDFELKMMDREERNALYKEQAEMEKREQEAREIARLRREATHKANPMPAYPPPRPKTNSHIPLTEPKSPLFTKRSKSTAVTTNKKTECDEKN